MTKDYLNNRLVLLFPSFQDMKVWSSSEWRWILREWSSKKFRYTIQMYFLILSAVAIKNEKYLSLQLNCQTLHYICKTTILLQGYLSNYTIILQIHEGKYFAFQFRDANGWEVVPYCNTWSNKSTKKEQFLGSYSTGNEEL